MINDSLIDAFTLCQHKCFLLKRTPSVNQVDSFEALQNQLKGHYKKRFIEICENNGNQFTYCHNTHYSQISLRSPHDYLVDVSFRDYDYDLQFDLAHKKPKELIPFYLLTTENPTKEDKLQATVKALIFNNHNYKIKIKEVYFVKSETAKTIKIQVVTLLQQAKKNLLELTGLCDEKLPSKPYWKPHCQICCFQSICMKELQEKDDLSLLNGLSEKEIIKNKAKGIFSITQLSYTFSPKKKLYSKKKFLPELKALALREKKTYVVNAPAFTNSKAELFFDIEGIPERKYFYLIGLIIKENESLRQFSFWNDGTSLDNFANFFNIIAPYADCPFYHFGSFEITVLKHILKKGGYEKYQQLIESIIRNSINLLKEFSENVYPPTYTNSLKEIANFIGFEWQEKHITGYKTIFLRKEWEIKKGDKIKASLIQYNIALLNDL